jgi:predicted nucleotidyltransferase
MKPIRATKALPVVTGKDIGDLCNQIAREFRPQKIILFGSHAYGKPGWDSDVDLLVIMPFSGTPHRQAVAIRSRIDASVALDLLVRTPRQISRRLAMGDSFIREILERGKVIYEADHQGMDQQSGG